MATSGHWPTMTNPFSPCAKAFGDPLAPEEAVQPFGSEADAFRAPHVELINKTSVSVEAPWGGTVMGDARVHRGPAPGVRSDDAGTVGDSADLQICRSGDHETVGWDLWIGVGYKCGTSGSPACLGRVFGSSRAEWLQGD